jgi:serine protease
MTFKYSLLTTAVLAGLALCADAAAANPQRFIVELKPNSDTRRAVDVLTANGVDVVRSFAVADATGGDIIAVNVDFDALPDLDALKAQLPEVQSYGADARRYLLGYATPEAADTDDTAPELQALYSDITVNGETTPWGIQAVQVEQVAYQGGRKVCIIDTGYALGHPDLQTGRVDGISRGAGPWQGDASANHGMHDHGTHVAGTIAGLGRNGQGVVGVIPGGDADLYIARAFNSDGHFVYASDLAGAMQDCAAAGANVVSMSLGGMFETKLDKKVVNQLTRAGVLLIAAAGNDGNSTFSYPASYDAVVSVAALDSNLQHADFSQHTSQVELAAPGVEVLSTIAENNGYDVYDGTSMATPHVAGVAALVWSNFKQCSNWEIRDALNASAKDLGTAGWDAYYGYGLVQARAAVDYLAMHPCKGR